MSYESWTERFARAVTNWTGSTMAFVLALGIVVVWALTGPLFNFNETWQLVINTGTTIVTFLMVFLIQRTQNKDSRAIHLKLNELVAAMQGASNRLVNIEDISEEELVALHQHYTHLAKLAAAEADLMKSHSIEEAQGRHNLKQGRVAKS
jgi:low affinity Fe/Cu permease